MWNCFSNSLLNNHFFVIEPKLFLPEETKQTQDWKKNFPEKHDFPKIVEMQQFADASQSLKKYHMLLSFSKNIFN